MILRILLALLLLNRLALAAAAASQAQQPPLVFENGKPSQYSYKDEVLTLRGGDGWVRSRRVFNDFVFTMEFRLMDAGTDAGVGLRTLTVAGGWPKSGYRIDLAKAPGTLEARQRTANVVRTESLPRPAAGEWHALVVSAEGPRITVTIDGAIATVATVATLVGSVVLDVRRGSVEFRHIIFRALPIVYPSVQLDDDSAPAGLEPPRLLKEVKPAYAASSMRRKVEGVVEMEVIILEDGRVGPVTVIKLPDPDLEQSAVAAVTQWLFTPAKLHGRPIPVRAMVELTFKLR